MTRTTAATLFLTRRNAWVVSPGDTSRALLEQQWDGVDVSAVFQQIVQNLSITHLTVILGHDMSYVFVLPPGTPADDAGIWASISEQIPVDVSEKSNAVWRTIADPAGSSAVALQVLAISPAHLMAIGVAVQQTGIHLQSVTGIGILLGAYATASTPQIIVWESLERLAVTAASGAVYGITTLPPSVHADFIAQLRSLAQSLWGISPSAILTDERAAPETVEQIPKEFTVKRLIMDPFSYDPMKVSDPWKNVLVLPKLTQKKPLKPEKPDKPAKPSSPRRHPSTLVIIGSIVIVLLMIALWLLFNFRY